MRFLRTTGVILFLVLGILSVSFGLFGILAGFAWGNGTTLFFGALLALAGGIRIALSVSRMRAMSRRKANAQRSQYPYPPQQPGAVPPLYGQPPQYGQQHGQPPQFPPQQEPR